MIFIPRMEYNYYIISVLLVTMKSFKHLALVYSFACTAYYKRGYNMCFYFMN